MLAQLKARWRAMPPAQRMAVGVGVPAVAGFALWQKSRSTAEAPADDTADVATDTDVGAGTGGAGGSGVDSGVLGQITQAWNDALAAVAGDVGNAAATAEAAADVAGHAQQTNARQSARLNRQRAAIARLRAREARLHERQQRNTARDRRQAAAIRRLRERQQAAAARRRARPNRRTRRQAPAGGPDPIAVAYAPGLVLVSPAFGATTGLGAAPAAGVTVAHYTPPVPVRVGPVRVARR